MTTSKFLIPRNSSNTRQMCAACSFVIFVSLLLLNRFLCLVPAFANEKGRLLAQSPDDFHVMAWDSHAVFGATMEQDTSVPRSFRGVSLARLLSR